MVKQEKTRKPKKKEEQSEAEPRDLQTKGDELKEKADDLIEEIDAVLQQYEEDFALRYTQRGGQILLFSIGLDIIYRIL